jgi:exopolysaccharide production protein ExoQ
MQDQARPSYADLASPIAAVLLACSLVLGGGGSPAPLLELILQGLAALAAAIWIGSNPAPFAQVPAAAWRIAALVAIIPVLHLIPLPTSWWQTLPGRSDQIAALELVGAADSWRPLSLSPPRTLASLLVALAALLSLVLVASLDQRARWRVIGVVAAGGVVTLLLGAAQLSGGPTSPLRFFDPEQIFLTGFQANHNSTADLLLVAMLAMAACAGSCRHSFD